MSDLARFLSDRFMEDAERAIAEEASTGIPPELHAEATAALSNTLWAASLRLNAALRGFGTAVHCAFWPGRNPISALRHAAKYSDHPDYREEWRLP